MTKALDALRAHTARLRNQKFVVPGVAGEDGKPFAIWFDPPSFAQGQRLKAMCVDDAGNVDEAKLTLYTVIQLARDEDGSPLFEDNGATVKFLTEDLPGAVLNPMAKAIMRVSNPADLGK